VQEHEGARSHDIRDSDYYFVLLLD
jgi:hypothetical protein